MPVCNFYNILYSEKIGSKGAINLHKFGIKSRKMEVFMNFGSKLLRKAAFLCLLSLGVTEVSAMKRKATSPPRDESDLKNASSSAKKQRVYKNLPEELMLLWSVFFLEKPQDFETLASVSHEWSRLFGGRQGLVKFVGTALDVNLNIPHWAARNGCVLALGLWETMVKNHVYSSERVKQFRTIIEAENESDEQKRLVQKQEKKSAEDEVQAMIDATSREQIEKRDTKGFTPLQSAAYHRNRNIVDILLHYGANVRALTDDKQHAVHLALQGDEKRPVNPAIAHLLIFYDNDFFATTRRAVTPKGDRVINLAASSNIPFMFKIVLKFCLAGLNHQEYAEMINFGGAGGNTPLHNAAKNGSAEIVRYLIDIGAHPVIHNAIGDSPLIAAVKSGNQKVFEKFSSEQGSVFTDLAHMTLSAQLLEMLKKSLIYSIERGNYKGVKELLDYGVSSNTDELVNNKKFIALCHAAFNGFADIVRLLLKNGACLEVKNGRYAETTLHIAVSGGHCDIAAMLLTAGADVDAITKHGKTALMYAHGLADTGKRAKMVALLERYGAKSGSKCVSSGSQSQSSGSQSQSQSSSSQSSSQSQSMNQSVVVPNGVVPMEDDV